MLNEKLEDNTRHNPVLWRASRGLQRNGLDDYGATYAANPVRRDDGSARVPQERRQKRSAAPTAAVAHGAVTMLWIRYRTTSLYLMTVLILLLVIALL